MTHGVLHDTSRGALHDTSHTGRTIILFGAGGFLSYKNTEYEGNE
jgi:hypothetical protein